MKLLLSFVLPLLAGMFAGFEVSDRFPQNYSPSYAQYAASGDISPGDTSVDRGVGSGGGILIERDGSSGQSRNVELARDGSLVVDGMICVADMADVREIAPLTSDPAASSVTGRVVKCGQPL